MGVKTLLGGIIVLSLVGSLFFYFMPFRNLQLEVGPNDYNFSVGNISEEVNMQFYPNMRYPSNLISYRISNNCSIKKKEDAKSALDFLASRTVLNFYPVSSREEILVSCDETAKFEGNTFVAGEGGPKKIVKSGDYNVILQGMILLIRDSDCATPNVAIHEFLHALGFVHSTNPNNIMYNFTDCKQTLGEDIPDLINALYIGDSLPNLVFENVSADINNRYLDINFSVRNQGLADAGQSKVVIKAGDDILKEMDVQAVKIGEGFVRGVSHFWIKTFSFDKITLEIDYDKDELSKKDNIVSLEIKK